MAIVSILVIMAFYYGFYSNHLGHSYYCMAIMAIVSIKVVMAFYHGYYGYMVI